MLTYRSVAADARPAGDHPSVVTGCLTTLACVLVLVAATAWVGLRQWEELIVPAGVATAAVLVGVGVSRGVRRRAWGYLIGVALAAGGVAAFVALVRWVAFR